MIFNCLLHKYTPKKKESGSTTTVEGTIIRKFLLFVLFQLLFNFIKEKCIKRCFVLTTCRMVAGNKAMSHVLLPLIAVLPTTDGYQMSLNMPNYTCMCIILRDGQLKQLKYTCWINRFSFNFKYKNKVAIFYKRATCS